MKKIIVCILIITLIFSASGCKKFKQGSKSSEIEKNMRVDKKESTVVVEKKIEEKEISTEKVEKSEILPKVESKEKNSNNSRKETTTNQQKVVEKKVEVTQPKEQPKKVEQPVQQEQPKKVEQPVQQEQPKVETPPSVSQKSDMEIAIEEQLKLGDPVTYYNGHPISIDECHSIGGDLKNRRETTLVNRYECVYTSYGNATAVGLIVQFTIDGQVYRKSYDEYKTMMN